MLSNDRSLGANIEGFRRNKEVPPNLGSPLRDHLLKLSQRRLDIFTRRDVVLDLVDKGSIGDTAGVGTRIVLALDFVSFGEARGFE